MRAALWVLRPIPRTDRTGDLRQRAPARNTPSRQADPDNVRQSGRNDATLLDGDANRSCLRAAKGQKGKPPTVQFQFHRPALMTS